MTDRKDPLIVVVSDGRGETGSQFVRAALVQFLGQRYRLQLRANVRSVRQVEQAVKLAAQRGGTIFWTLVGDETRRAMADWARELLVPAVDVLGPAFSALHGLFKRAPGATPGLPTRRIASSSIGTRRSTTP